MGAGIRPLRRNVLLNLAGHGLPLAAAVLAVPPILAALGEERFAILAIAWALLSFFGILDLGVGRALTKLVAERLARDGEHEVAGLTGAALVMTVALGIAAGGVLAVAAPWLVHHLLRVPEPLQAEALTTIRLLALAVPAVIASTGLRGVLEARHRFDLVNAVRAPMGVLVFAGPLAVLPYSSTLPAVVAVVVAARAFALVAYAALAWRVQPWRLAFEPARVRTIARLGGWMTVSNVVAPVLLYADRFVIANQVSLEAVTFYAAPFEIISRLSVIPAAIMGVVFPAFSHSLATDGDDARALYRRSTLAVACLTAPAATVIALLARPALTAWLGPAFAERSAGVAAILAVGVLVHALAQPPFNLLQAAGRPDVTARLHLLEAPLYLVYLLWLTGRFGITGTACAWLLRVSLSMVALRWLARRVVLASSARESRP